MPFQYASIFKYGYQALMLNEYNGEELECMDTSLPLEKQCSPLKTFASPEDLAVSVIALAAMYVGCYIIALWIMKCLSRKYE